MARIRSTKPEFWADEELATALCRDARMLYMGLWNEADEHSRLRGDPRYVKGQVFPYDDDLTPAVIDGLLDDLAREGKVIRYRVGKSSYLFLPKLAGHQRLEPDKVASRLPGPDDPGADKFEPDPDNSAPRADSFRSGNEIDSADSEMVADLDTQIRADKSARDSDKSAPRAKDHALLYVAGSMEHGAWSMESGIASPSAPLPSAKTRGRADSTRGTRIPDDFEPTAELIAWAKTHAPTATRADHEAFMDYWRGAPGAKGRKTDWPATWRNWMRREHEQRANRPTRASPVVQREHNGLLLNPGTIADLERTQRFADKDRELEATQNRPAIGGVA